MSVVKRAARLPILPSCCDKTSVRRPPTDALLAIIDNAGRVLDRSRTMVSTQQTGREHCTWDIVVAQILVWVALVAPAKDGGI